MMDWNDKNQTREYHRKYWRIRRQKIFDFLGGECINCKSTHNLEVDHIDPLDKSFDIKKNVSISNPEVLEELKKCQLLCRDCHLEKTSKENTGFTHGTMYGWMKAKCICDECNERKLADYDKKNKKRRK